MYADGKVIFQNYIKEEKSSLISQCDEREKVYEEICIYVRKKRFLKSFHLKCSKNITANAAKTSTALRA